MRKGKPGPDNNFCNIYCYAFFLDTVCKEEKLPCNKDQLTERG